MLSCIQLFATLWTTTCQAPLAMGFFQTRTLEWVAISFSRGSSGPRIKAASPMSLTLQANSLPAEPPGKSHKGSQSGQKREKP